MARCVEHVAKGTFALQQIELHHAFGVLGEGCVVLVGILVELVLLHWVLFGVDGMLLVQ